MSSILEGMFGDDEPLDENLRKWFKEKWVRFGPDGKIKGPCARGSDREGKPKCLPQKKAHSLGKKGRKYAAAKKRREDPNPERRGKAKNVATKKKTDEQQLDEKCWDTHKQVGMKKKGNKMVPNCVPKESIKEDQASMFTPESKCPHCGGEMVSEEIMNEKKDACYYKVKSRYKVWPSAYASGALVKCRKKGASNWGTKSESSIMKGLVREDKNMYPVTYRKFHMDPKDPSKVEYVEIYHANIDLGDGKPTTPERMGYLVKNSDTHKNLKAKGYTLDTYGEHKTPTTFYTYPVKITKGDDLNEEWKRHKSRNTIVLRPEEYAKLKNAKMAGEFNYDFARMPGSDEVKFKIPKNQENKFCADIDKIIDFGSVSAKEVFGFDPIPFAEGDSDISGSRLGRVFIITADLAEGGRKSFNVRGVQSEKQAIEKFKQHYSMAKIVDVKEKAAPTKKVDTEPMSAFDPEWPLSPVEKRFRRLEKDRNDVVDEGLDPAQEKFILKELMQYLKDEFNGKAWFNGGSYSYLLDVKHPNIMRSSDGGTIKVKNFIEGIKDYADKWAVDDFFSIQDPYYWKEYFRPAQAIRGQADHEGLREDADKIANLAAAYQQARAITKQIKHEDPAGDIITAITSLAEKYGLSDNSSFQIALQDVYDARSSLESAVYALDEVFLDAYNDAKNAEEDNEELNEDAIDIRNALNKLGYRYNTRDPDTNISHYMMGDYKHNVTINPKTEKWEHFEHSGANPKVEKSGRGLQSLLNHLKNYHATINEAGRVLVKSLDGVEKAFSNPNAEPAKNWAMSYAHKKNDPAFKKFKPKIVKPKKPSTDQIMNAIMFEISKFPESEPYEVLKSYMHKNNLEWEDLNKAAEKNGYDGVWGYWEELHKEAGTGLARESKMREGQIYSTGGGCGQAMRKYVAKPAGTFKNESSIMKGIQRESK